MHAPLPRWPELRAPAAWRCIEFISDLHLQASEPQTHAAWQDYLKRSSADAIFILGDLFEVWVGDDMALGPQALPFEADCVETLRQAAARRPVYLMHGNRDFLIGSALFSATGVQALSDPTLLVLGEARYLLSHGDALCLSDLAYQQFRATVRAPDWQTQFMAQSLDQRLATGRAARAASMANHRNHAPDAMYEPDTGLVQRWLAAADARALIHGHTHRPADHALDYGRWRVVLSDWDLGASPARAEVLRLTLDGWQRLALDAI